MLLPMRSTTMAALLLTLSRSLYAVNQNYEEEDSKINAVSFSSLDPLTRRLDACEQSCGTGFDVEDARIANITVAQLVALS